MRLTEEQALELLKWTSNNTRNNLIYSASNPNEKLDVPKYFWPMDMNNKFFSASING